MMSQKKYADTDFFLALMKDSDWLKEKAKQIYEKNKENIFVSPFTIVELMIICKREQIPMKEILVQISRIAKLDGFSWNIFLKACDHVEKGATIFDSLLMGSVSQGEQIISSDKVYEKFGFNVLDLREK